MPYTRKTARRPLRHIITLGELDRTNQQVTCEMEKLGLWFPELDEVTVWLVPTSFNCYGWFKGEDDIYIPAVTGAQLSDLLFGCHTRLTDILRHEWAHALADRCPNLVQTKSFIKAFETDYTVIYPVSSYDPSTHLTPYAATSPCEDFAETFCFYLRHKGRLPVRLHSKETIVRKWRVVEGMANRVTSR